MTVGELIKELEKLPSGTLVAVATDEGWEEPQPEIKKLQYGGNYWAGMTMFKIPKDIELVEL